MKKFYFFLVMLFAGITAATAEDYTMTITVDDASHVNVSYGSYDPDTGDYTKIFVEAVDNVFTVTAPMNTTINIYAATGYEFSSILDADGSEQLSSYNRFEYNPYMWGDGMSYTISTKALEYAGKVTVQCDDPSAVDIQTSLYRKLTLEDTTEPQDLWLLAEELCDGENQPTTSFMPKSSGKPFYSFKQNDTEIAGRYGYYNVNLTAGDEIVITTIFPEMPCTVTINVQGAEVADVLTIEVDEEPITATSVFQVNAGSKLALFPSSDYNYTNFTVNGVAGYFYSSWSEYILGDTEITLTATAKPRYDVTIDIDTPENVKFYIGQPYDENLKTLQSGENTFNVVKGTYLFLNTADSNSSIDGVYVNGSEENSAWSTQGWNYTVSDNLSVRVATSHFERETSFIYYLDGDPETIMVQFDNTGFVPEVQPGYNVIYFNPEHDGPFAVYWQWDGGPARYVYRNGEKFEPIDEWTTSIVWDTMNQDDVVKAFVEEPTTYTVNLAGNAAIGSDYSVVVDRVTNITSADEPLTVLSGTELTLANINETETLTIDVDGLAVDYEPGEDTTIIFDGTETTCNITVNLPEPIAVPENLYIFGDIDGIGWNPGSSAAFDKADNVFTYYGEITGGGYFGISEVQSTEWGEVNAARWSGAQGADQTPNLNEPTELQRGKDASMKLPAGTYKFEVTFTDALVTLTVSEWSGVELINAADAAADAEYYTLQGVRVAAPAAGGVYVVRRGAEVSKQYVR